jgi:hypothetical protein
VTGFLCWVHLIGMSLAALVLARAYRIAPSAFDPVVTIFYLIAWPIPLGHFIAGAIEELRR